VLDRRAAAEPQQPASADLIIARARLAARVRHTVDILVATIVGLALVLVGLEVVHRGQSGPGTPTAQPIPITSVGVLLLSGNTLQAPYGGRAVLRVPYGLKIYEAQRGNGGFVALTTQGLWWLPDTGPPAQFHPTEIDLSHNWQVSADGARVVVLDDPDVNGRSDNVITSYRLPGAQLDQTMNLGASAPNSAWDKLVGLAGNLALVLVPARQGAVDTSTSLRWNIATGELSSSAIGPVTVLATNNSGTVLRRTGPVTIGYLQMPQPDGLVCLHTVDITEVFDSSSPGVCGPVAVGLDQVVVSPGSDWMAARATGAAKPAGVPPTGSPRLGVDDSYVPTRFVLLRSAQLNAGSYQPVLLPETVVQVFGWVSYTRLLVLTGPVRFALPYQQSLAVCRLDGSCTPVALPPDMPQATPIFLPPPLSLYA
jgi:hypothetical protein